MFNVEPRDSEESQYEYDEPKKPLTPRQIANYALVATGAVTSVAFGLQVVGPAVASAMYPSSTQVESANPSPDVQASSAAPAGYPESEYSIAANLGVTPASLAGVTAVAATPSATVTQIQLPSGAPSFGNLSSATPSGGSMASWGSGSGEDDDDDDRGDDDDEDEDEDDD